LNILDTIVAEKQREISQLPRRSNSVTDLRRALESRGDRRDFAGALLRPRIGSVALIAEVKKASPSAGVICSDFDPVRLAQAYELAGATCLSVLTDEKFFQGSLSYLREIRKAVSLPLLRKDFIIDERQLWEAVEWGADAVLLIVSILGGEKLRQLHCLASEAGLSVLVEVHDEVELERAMAIGAGLIGVNNRDLKTFAVDLATTERLASRLRSVRADSKVAPISDAKRKIILVAESGIHTRAEIERLKNSGADAVLIGETLMREKNVAAKVKELLG
jgi:indole-3-glycerol phosphate synthase